MAAGILLYWLILAFIVPGAVRVIGLLFGAVLVVIAGWHVRRHRIVVGPETVTFDDGRFTVMVWRHEVAWVGLAWPQLIVGADERRNFAFGTGFCRADQRRFAKLIGARTEPPSRSHQLTDLPAGRRFWTGLRLSVPFMEPRVRCEASARQLRRACDDAWFRARVGDLEDGYVHAEIAVPPRQTLVLTLHGGVGRVRLPRQLQVSLSGVVAMGAFLAVVCVQSPIAVFVFALPFALCCTVIVLLAVRHHRRRLGELISRLKEAGLTIEMDALRAG